MHNPIKLERSDSIYQLTYFGHEAGFIGKIRTKNRDGYKWRAVSVFGHVQHTHTLQGARQWLLDTYH
jgi:hypothetical protein